MSEYIEYVTQNFSKEELSVRKKKQSYVDNYSFKLEDNLYIHKKIKRYRIIGKI